MNQAGSYIFAFLILVSFSLVLVLNSEMTSKYLRNVMMTKDNDIAFVYNLPDQAWLNVSHSSNCQPNGNVAFLKTHKTGSTTLRNILNKYGLSNNLSFLLNNDSSAGHIFRRLKDVPHSDILPPIGVEVGDYKNYKFNITNVHMRPDWKELRQMMNPSSIYITILRHPVDQWLSSFQYFHRVKVVKEYLHLEPDPVKAFVKFKGKLKDEGSSICNQQMRDIEFEPQSNHLNNTKYVKKKIEDYSKRFGLVLITEYFDESLILLKKLICWQLDDILYIKMREQPSPLQADSETRAAIEKLNKADMMLYTHFNDTLWQLVSAYGPDFDKDLKQFRHDLNSTQEECIGEKVVKIVAGNHENVRYLMKKESEKCKKFVAYTSSGDIIRKQRNQKATKT